MSKVFVPPPKWLKEKAREAAHTYALDPFLVYAVVQQESDWNPKAYRREKAFGKKYVDPSPDLNDTERIGREISWGLMQVMGQTARELGFRGPYLPELCEPEIGLKWGCIKLFREMVKADGDKHKALLGYNGGGNPAYADEVIEKIANYPSEKS
jgi:soluble lytic murein transglycosylase-like protein